jgi:tetratricopeptide (TPR) repeat protein
VLAKALSSPALDDGTAVRALLALVFSRSGETRELAFRFDKAAADFEEAVELADGANDKLAGQIRFRRVRALLSLGRFASDNAALQSAADEAASLAKALAENKSDLLGLRALALHTLAYRSGDKAELEQAVAVYRAAVDAAPRHQDPARRASAMNSLGQALTDLAEQDADQNRYREAIDAFRAALEETTRKERPVDWAQIMLKRGTALLHLGMLEDDAESLARSVDSYKAALETLDDDMASLEQSAVLNEDALRLFDINDNRGWWLDAKIRLAHALAKVGYKRSDPAMLRKSA